MYNKVPKDKLEYLQASIEKDKIEKAVVGAVIVAGDEKVLLLRRVAEDFMGGLVEIPSGGVDKGETLIEALVREVKEETGLDIERVVSYVGSFDYITGSSRSARQFNFRVQAVGDIILNPTEHDYFYMHNPRDAEFDKLNISPETKAIIRQAVF